MIGAAPRARRMPAAAIVLVAGSFGAVLACYAVQPQLLAAFVAFQTFRDAVTDAVAAAAPWPMLAYPLAAWTRGVLLAPHLFVPLFVIVLIERRWPAVPGQASVSPALVNDFLWYLADIGCLLSLNAVVANGVHDASLRHFAVTAGMTASLPVVPRLAVAVLLGDLLEWAHHYVRHKIPALWWFHTVHHAQRQLNAWTNERVHAVDYLAGTTIRVVLATCVGLSSVTAVGYTLAVVWYTRLYHANIRADFGVLRFVLVTPHSHRLHHSRRPEHQNKNFGVLFSIWDRLFGTQCDDDVYPETGIADNSFPAETGWQQTLSLQSFIAQQLYPLRLMWRWCRATLASLG